MPISFSTRIFTNFIILPAFGRTLLLRSNIDLALHSLHVFAQAQWEESFFPKTSVAIVILYWLKWAGYLAVAGLNLLAQLPDRISPFGV